MAVWARESMQLLKQVETWIVNGRYTEYILWGIVLIMVMAFMLLLVVGCAPNTLYNAQGTGIDTVLWLARAATGLLLANHDDNQQALLDLTVRYSVDIQSAFNGWVKSTTVFLQTVVQLKQAIEMDLATSRAIPHSTRQETEQAVRELDALLQTVNEIIITDTWEQG